MNATSPYLFFNGTCAEAMRFYERTLGGKLEMMTHAESPAADQTPPGTADRILHARLVFDGGVLLASDAMASEPYKGMHGFFVSLIYSTAAEGKRVFDALGKGGHVIMPFEKTFWADGFGMLVDRLGTPWMINGAMTTA
jgi:PhnB protein